MGKMTRACWKDFKNFTPAEFKCNCGCEEEHVNMNCDLVRMLQRARDHFKCPITVTCGHRCKKYNTSLVQKGWAVATSTHMTNTNDGSVHAADIVISKYTTRTKRKEAIAWFKEQPEFKFAYHYDPLSSSTRERNAKNMGNAIHVEVK